MNKVQYKGQNGHDNQMKKYLVRLLSLLVLLLLSACDTNQVIINSIDERDANEIIVFLSSKGIHANKIAAPSTAVGGGGPSNLYSITVLAEQSIDAMAILNKVGLPRRQGTTLLELFAKSGLMTSATEETVRYQAGLAEELGNTIRKIDGVIDANVQISFPPTQTVNVGPAATQPKITAAVYIKHYGILEDPNSHLEIKIKRLLSGSVNGLSYEDVIVVSDRARFADIVLPSETELIGVKGQQTYTNLWGLVLAKSSLGRFRFIFFTFLILLLLLCVGLAWVVYKFYPQMKTAFLKRKELPPETAPPNG